MALVGPGAQQEVATDIRPLLEGSSEFEYVTILNPLSDDFVVRVAQDVPVNMPIEIKNKTALVQSEGDITRAYGLALTNPDYQSRKHIYTDTIIPAGQTKNFKGNEAQVAVRQIVNEIMQREGNTRKMSDPTLRAEVEERVVQNRGSIQTLMDEGFNTPRQQATTAINRSNEVIDEPAFPGLTEEVTSQDRSRAREVEQLAGLDQEGPTPVGHPKRTDS